MGTSALATPTSPKSSIRPVIAKAVGMDTVFNLAADSRNLAISNSAMLTPSHVPGGYRQGRDLRRRRHAGNQVVRIGCVRQALSVVVSATAVQPPRPSFSRGRPEAQLLGQLGTC